jgi:peptidoglycan/xylan/chitin deacetylase (PgdA/CDA1 family)
MLVAVAAAVGLLAPPALADSSAAIDAHHLSLGGAAGPLGAPVSPVQPVPGGEARSYERGQILVSSTTPPRAVWGAIFGRYSAMGRTESVLRFPVTDELPAPDGRGRYNHFQGGSIYWTPSTGGREVYGAIRGRWSALGWERSVVGYPVTGELATPTRPGRYNHFERGSIYWSPSSGAHEVYGAIRARWAGLGWETSVLGFPVTGELGTPTKPGRFSHFQGGSVYWSPATGAHEVYGAIRETWQNQGFERGPLGFPTSGEYDVPGGRRSDFQGGSLTWERATGRVVLRPIGPVATGVWGTRPTANALGVDTTRLATSRPVVALTVDLGSSDAGVDRILRALSEHDARASFFLTGEFADRYPHRVVQIAHAGHVMGNHSYSHPDFTTRTSAQIATELARADTAIGSRIGRTSKPLFRFPYGARNSTVLGIVNGQGYAAVRWTTDTLGWMGTTGQRPQSVRSVIDRTLGGATPGQIVLMHGGASPDGRVLDAEALPAILNGYRERGYSFVTLASLTS